MAKKPASEKTLLEFSIPAKTLGKVKKLVENRNQISQALQAVNESIGSSLLALIDANGGESDNLDDYIINIETGTVSEKGTSEVASPEDVEK
jgi:hypothetical protein